MRSVSGLPVLHHLVFLNMPILLRFSPVVIRRMLDMGKVTKAQAPSRLGVKAKGQIVEVAEGTLERIFRAKDTELAQASLLQCWNALPANERDDEQPCSDQRYFMAAAVAEIAPRDAIERMLTIQMAATHVAFIRASRHLGAAETIPQLQAHCNGVNKLARTYAAQIEALRKYRNGGAQTIRVERVTVEAGTQAIVGHVQHEGRGDDER